MEADPQVVDETLGGLSDCGFDCARVVIKSDQEPAIMEVQDEISQRRRAAEAKGTAEENSRLGNSAFNGRFERCIQELGRQVRTLKIAPGERLNTTLELTHPLVPWLIMHAADLLNICPVHDGGKTRF